MDDSVCARCARANPTCCRIEPEHANACFPLSAPEAERIRPYAEAMGLPPSAGEANTRDFQKLMHILFPDRPDLVREVFPLGGTHTRLPLDSDGKCLFLQAKGCALPRSARPWYCLLFPIWVRKGFFERFWPQDCLLTHETPRLQDALEAIGLTRDSVGNLYRALCRDWGMERHDNQR